MVNRTGESGDVGIDVCQRCGMGLTWPELADTESLYVGRDSAEFNRATGVARLLKTIFFRRQAAGIIRACGQPPAHVLDIGCGNGLWTRCLGDLLPSSSVWGVDFHDAPPAELEDRRYLPMSQLFAARREGADLVVAFHVLEHVNDPIQLLTRLRSLLKPGGHLALEVPNIACIWGRIFGKYWDPWYLPYHRLHFNRQSLQLALERCGFSVAYIENATSPSFGRSLATALGRRNTTFFILLTAFLQPIQLLAEWATNRPSVLRAVARRTDKQVAGKA